MLCLRGINTFKLINRAFVKDSIHFSNYLDFKRMANESELRKWEIPSKKDKFLTGLYVKNSLSPSSKVEFVPEVPINSTYIGILMFIGGKKG